MKQAELFDIKGHVAIVTGAASGLGLAFAEVMAENGATVVMVDVNEAELARHARVSRARAVRLKRTPSTSPRPERCAR